VNDRERKAMKQMRVFAISTARGHSCVGAFRVTWSRAEKCSRANSQDCAARAVQHTMPSRLAHQFHTFGFALKSRGASAIA
jgi:hypothetical protein